MIWLKKLSKSSFKNDQNEKTKNKFHSDGDKPKQNKLQVNNEKI
jgi:hypothetical protein